MARDPGRLSVSVTHADGRVTRWGPDEVDGKNVPNDLSFGTSIPGGFQDMSCSLLRRIDQDHPDQDLFDEVTVYAPGNRIVWQGRMQQFPRSHGSSTTITPGAVGWSAHLRDDPSFREIYIDQTFGSWGSPSLARATTLAAGGTPTGKISAGATDGGLTWTVPTEALPAFETAELHYDAGGYLTISKIGYRGARTGASWAGSFEAAALFGDTLENFGGSGASVALTLDNTLRNATISPRQYVMLRARTSAGVTPAAGHLQSIDRIALYGNSGVPTTPVQGDFDGFQASDVIANVISRAAPLLTYQLGTSIEGTGYPIGHLVYRELTTAEDVITDINKFHLYDWGVYENREFFYRRPNPDRLSWEARLEDGAFMDADGLTGEQVINGVIVSFTDAAGVQRAVGPPYGYYDYGTTALQDTSVDNPATSHGISRKLALLSLSFPATQSDATQIGAAYLAERSLATRRGSMTLTGTVRHPTEGPVPVSRVRAGDWIKVADLNGENADVPRKIISTSYSHASRSVSLSLDNTVAKLDAILSRVGIETGIALGGGF